MAEETIRVTLELLPEQLETINQLFNYNDWDYREIQRQNISSEVSTQTCREDENDSNVTNFRIQQDHDQEECIYCLCRPCITDERNRQLWWESENSPPNSRNSSLRKELYKRFWTMLLHRNAWSDLRYVEAKTAALQGDRRFRKYVWHRRDIIPKCVLKIGREWFPNPVGEPYMGHLWE